MIETAPLKNKWFQQSNNRLHAWFAGPVVTIVVLLKVVQFWDTFLAWEKFIAIVLALSLSVSPLVLILAERTGRWKVGRSEIVFFGYAVLFLAVELFTVRR